MLGIPMDQRLAVVTNTAERSFGEKETICLLKNTAVCVHHEYIIKMTAATSNFKEILRLNKMR